MGGRIPIAGFNRGVNLIWFMVYILCFSSAFTLAQILNIKRAFHTLVRTTVVAVFILITMKQPSVTNLWKDLITHKAQRLRSAWIYRQQEVESQFKNDDIIVVSGLPRVNSLQVNTQDLTNNPNNWLNKVNKRYYDIPKHVNLVRRSYDYKIFQHIVSQHLPTGSEYSLSVYKNEYRKYLLFQFPEDFKTSENFVIEQRQTSELMDGDIIDEDALFKFNWDNGIHEGSFINRMACEHWKNNKFCRLPLAKDATGVLIVNWLGINTALEL